MLSKNNLCPPLTGSDRQQPLGSAGSSGVLCPPDNANSPAERNAWARAREGFTLIELILVMALLSLLASIAVPQMRRATNLARTARAISEIHLLQHEITEYAMTRPLPATLNDIGRGGMLDPWGRPYVYNPFPPCKSLGKCVPPGSRKDHFLVPLNSDYDLYSLGADGLSQPPLTANTSKDDIIRANDGSFIGVAASY